MSALAVKTQADLAAKLDTSQPAIAMAIQREKIPDVWLYKVAYQTGRRVEWLRTGEGPEFAETVAELKHHYGLDEEAVRLYLERRLALEDDRRHLIDRLMDLLLRADDTTRDALLALLQAHPESPRHRRDAPGKRKKADSA